MRVPLDKLGRGVSEHPALVLVAAGSFNPVTYMHLRMFESARDHYHSTEGFRVLGGYLSPVNDAYKKPGLAAAKDRVAMLKAATADSDWLMVDEWEAAQDEFQPTLRVLDRISAELNRSRADEEHVQVRLLCGADLLESMHTSDAWDEESVRRILGVYGLAVVNRAGYSVRSIINASDVLHEYSKNINIVTEVVPNEVSSTLLRQQVRRGLSINYLTAPGVVRYIAENKLYERTPSTDSTKK